MSQPWGTEGGPARITGTQIVVTPGGDIAEVVTDSRREAWGRWYTAGPRSWSAWWHIDGKPEAVALALYTAPEPAAGADPDDGQAEGTGSTADAALVAVARRAPDARSWFLLTASGLSEITL